MLAAPGADLKLTLEPPALFMLKYFNVSETHPKSNLAGLGGVGDLFIYCLSF